MGATRVSHYLNAHGIAEDLVAALALPPLRPFFAGLETIVRHQLRQAPLAATAVWIRQALVAARDRQNLSFEVAFPGFDSSRCK